jgi:tetratricopeptide (TPR) repeat protein
MPSEDGGVDLVRTGLIGLLALLLIAGARPSDGLAAGDPWRSVRTRHFELVGSVPERELRSIGQRFEHFRLAIGTLLPNASTASPFPTVVVVFRNDREMAPYGPPDVDTPSAVPAYFHSSPGAHYIVLSAGVGEEQTRNLQHEYVHLVLRQSLRFVPTWVHEGLAEYYSTFQARRGGRGAVIGEPIPAHTIRLQRQLLPIGELLDVGQDSPQYNEAGTRSIFYAQSWALVHYLLLGQNGARAAQFARFLALLQDGTAADAAFGQAFGAAPDEIHKEVRQYLRRPTLPAQSIEFADRLTVEEVGEARPLTPAEVDARLGDLLFRIGRKEEARRALERAAGAEAAPALAYTSLGVWALLEKQANEAILQLTRATARPDADFAAYYWYARALNAPHESRDGLVTTYPPGIGERIGEALQRARELNPAFADAWSLEAFTLLVRNHDLDRALALIDRALALQPGRADFVLILAQIHARRGHVAGARALLRSVADGRMGGEHKDEAASLLRRLPNAPASSPPAAIQKTLPTIIELRALQDGEQRELGHLLEITCEDSATLRLRTGDRTVTYAVADSIEYIFHGSESAGPVECGPRQDPPLVYVTFRTEPIGAVAGIAVAVEVLPKGYRP